MTAFKNWHYPPPSGPYKISLKNTAPWRTHSLARLQISVGKANSEGDKFFSFTEWAAARFDRVQLIVSDSLQRWNLIVAHGMDMAPAWQESRNAGDRWLARNADAIAQISNPEIIRWDSCLANPRFAPARARLEEMAQTDPAFQMALQSTVSAFWQRNAGKDGQDSPEHHSAFVEASTAFLIEELAVFTFLCRPRGIDVYPGSWMSEIFNALRQQDGALFGAFRQDWQQVDFTRNKGYAPVAAQAA